VIKRVLYNCHSAVALLFAVCAAAIGCNDVVSRNVAVPLISSACAAIRWLCYFSVTYARLINEEWFENFMLRTWRGV
jgi:dolichyl-phosphate-mannose--protein O-mannosyl transferase